MGASGCPLGAHTSAAGGAYCAILEGQKIGATTIQFFTSNQKRWQGKPLSDKDIQLWKDAVDQAGFTHIMSHDSYLINLGSPKEEGLQKSRIAFHEEVERCLQLGVDYLNFHPGVALDGTVEECLDTIVASLLPLQGVLENGKTRLLLETTAGQGTCVGRSFNELGYIIERVKGHIPIGVCIDTCHIFVAGYDIRTATGWEAVLAEFEKVVGLEHLYAFHVNDSIKGLGTRVDRHAPLGKGEIGLESFKVLMSHPKTRHLPKFLETPGGVEEWPQEIALLREYEKQVI
ncbi:MAG: nfo [Chlamydiales bacterium]|jgi:deoxyribonuclease-4|nr:nfo [Chlamydiales bacterium]